MHFSLTLLKTGLRKAQMAGASVQRLEDGTPLEAWDWGVSLSGEGKEPTSSPLSDIPEPIAMFFLLGKSLGGVGA